MTEVLRTPEERFVDLPDFPYDPVYIDDLKGFEGLRMHYVDEGPQNADHIFLCLHGEKALKMLTTFFCAYTANQRGATFTGR
jgi:hypothetical protein